MWLKATISLPADYECLGNPEFGDDAAMASALRDARMSFMSGHATFAFQSMMFGVLYLQGWNVMMCHASHVLILKWTQKLQSGAGV